MKSPIRLFIFLAILLATATVAAQVYKWVDKDGKVQYSDVPPPPGATQAEPKKVDTPTSASTAAGAAPAGKSLKERAKDSDKAKSDAAEKAKKDADVQQAAEVDAENCRTAKKALADLETGRPLNRTNDSGEREFISDEQRQTEMNKARAAIAASCKG